MPSKAKEDVSRKMHQERKEDKLLVNRNGEGFGKPAFKDLHTKNKYYLDKSRAWESGVYGFSGVMSQVGK